MRKVIIGLVAVFVLMVVMDTNAQTYLTNQDQVSEHADRVMGYFADQDFQNTYIELQKYWPLSEYDVILQEAETIQKFNLSKYGDMIEADFIKELTLKDYLVRKVYVVKCEKRIIRAWLTYYHNNEGWVVNGFEWDDGYDEFFE